jgi:hypothetical protein
VKETWQLVEQQHGVWWAYQGELPSSEAFQIARQDDGWAEHVRPDICCGEALSVTAKVLI